MARQSSYDRIFRNGMKYFIDTAGLTVGLLPAMNLNYTMKPGGKLFAALRPAIQIRSVKSDRLVKHRFPFRRYRLLVYRLLAHRFIFGALPNLVGSGGPLVGRKYAAEPPPYTRR